MNEMNFSRYLYMSGFTINMQLTLLLVVSSTSNDERFDEGKQMKLWNKVFKKNWEWEHFMAHTPQVLLFIAHELEQKPFVFAYISRGRKEAIKTKKGSQVYCSTLLYPLKSWVECKITENYSIEHLHRQTSLNWVTQSSYRNQFDYVNWTMWLSSFKQLTSSRATTRCA